MDIKENQIISCCLLIGSERLNEDGECGDYDYNSYPEKQEIFNNVEDLEEYLNSYGLKLNEFKEFNFEDEPTRLNFAREEIEENIKYYVDYDLYLEVYTREAQKNYLEEFKEKL